MSKSFKIKLLIVLIGFVLYLLFPDKTPLHNLGVCAMIASGIWLWSDVLKDN